MKITDERMEQLLPQNILDSELSLASKKVLTAMLDWYQNSKAIETKIVAISNKCLCAIAGVGGTSLQESLRELNDYNLVSRRIGTKLGNASEYTIHFKNLLKPLKKMTFEERFAKELESLENPISTTVQNSTLQYITEQNITEHNIPLHNIEEQNNTLQNEKKESSDFFEDFKKKVDSKLVGENEDELLDSKVRISSELSRKRMEIGSSVHSRCSSYLNRKYEEAIASV